MARLGKLGRRPSRKPKEKDALLRSRLMGGGERFRRDEHLRIAPKHPGMGRR
jgi:hypothetical protein